MTPNLKKLIDEMRSAQATARSTLEYLNICAKNIPKLLTALELQSEALELYASGQLDADFEVEEMDQGDFTEYQQGPSGKLARETQSAVEKLLSGEGE